MPGAERHLPAEQADPGAQQRIWGPGLRPGQQRARRVGRAGQVLGLRGREQRVPPGGQDRRSARPNARGRPPPRPGPRAPAPGPRTARAPQPRPRPGPTWPGRDARPGGRDRPADRWPRPAPGAPAGDRPTTRPGRRPSAPADVGTVPCAPISSSPVAIRGPRCPDPEPELPGRPPHQGSIAGRLGRREHKQQPGVLGQLLAAPQETLLDLARQPAAHPAAPNRPPAPRRQVPRQLQQRKRVSLRLGHDPLRHPVIQRPPDHRIQQFPCVSLARPSTTSSGSPLKSALSSRIANIISTDSACSRRAANARACAEARSSHCASSTTHSSGRSAATSDSRLSTARPTRNRSGGGPASRPNAVPRAARCGPGSRSRRSSIGPHS